MPELPEVETIRRDLRRVIVGQTIQAVQVRKKRVLRQPGAMVKRVLAGQAITKIERRGKLLLFSLTDKDLFFGIHLKMTGQLMYRRKNKVVAGGHDWPVAEELPNKYTAVIFTFADGSQLFFNDVRQFGYVKLMNNEERASVLAGYGPEPLSSVFVWQDFYQAIKGRTTSLKAALLNQQIVAGIGNIYADEICFSARLRPNRSVGRLSQTQCRAVHTACQRILRSAIQQRGTTFRDYADTRGKKGNFSRFLKVYGRVGQPCRRCRTPLQKIQTAGRGTTFCPQCQP